MGSEKPNTRITPAKTPCFPVPKHVPRQLPDSGRIDLALYTRTDGIALVRSMGLSSIAPLSPPPQEVDMYLYLNKKHQEAVPKIVWTMRDMMSDGTYNRIMSSLLAE